MEPFSTAAAAVSLAPLALQLCLKLFNTISKLRGISAELRRLSLDLQESMQIVSEIQNLCNTHGDAGHIGGGHLLFETIGSRLITFVQDMEELQVVIGRPSDKDEIRRNRFGMVLKSVFNERKIAELSSRLAVHKSNLHIMLAAALGHDGQAIRKNLSHITKGIDCLRDGQTTLEAQVTESSTRSDGNFSTIRTDIKALESLIRNINHSRLSATTNDRATTIILYGSVADGAATLAMLCPRIRHLLLPSTSNFDVIFPKGVAKWFLSQLNAILSDLEEDESEELMLFLPGIHGPRYFSAAGRYCAVHETAPAIAPPGRTSRKVRREDLTHDTRPKFQTGISPIESSAIERDDPNGTICMIVKREDVKSQAWSPTDRKMIGRVVFIPSRDCLLAGITVDFARYFRGGNEIPRTLSTFGIHSDDSPVFKYLKAGDTDMIREMLSRRQISPNDRDQKANTLIWYATSDSYNYQMCRLLLEEGAEASDCNKYGDHALTIVLRKLPATSSDKSSVGEDALSLVRLLIERCRGEASSMCLYKRSQANVQAEAGPFHCILSPLNHKISTLELFRLILEHGFDLESRDVNGNTPLLYSLYYTPEFQLVGVVSMLLSAEADVLALNKYGEGGLHLLLRRLSACNNYKMSSELTSSIIDILVILLQRGCDPTLGNVVGYTPLDAALSPTALPLLFTALERARVSITRMLQTLDERSGITLLDTELNDKVAKVLRRDKVVEPLLLGPVYHGLHIDEPCYLCGCLPSNGRRQPPFDEFASAVVDELGFGIHMMVCMHYQGDTCLRIQDDDSCYCLDYHPHAMTDERRRLRSLNRHVAYRMWRQGVLGSPGDCQEWAFRA